MRKLPLFALILMLALMIGAAFALPHTASAESFDDIRTIDIVFDGYCDGMHLDIDTNTRAVTGYRTGSCIPQTNLSGNAARGQLRLVDSFYGLYVIIYKNGTWEYYDSNGNLFNSGTWSRGVPSAAEGGASSVR